jgi:hypothetical protein
MSDLSRRRDWRVWLLLLLTALFTAGLLRLKINFSFDAFFARNDPAYLFYERYRQEFPEEQNYMVYMALRGPVASVFDRAFLQSASAVFDSAGRMRGIDSLVSAPSMRLPRRKGLGWAAEPLLDLRSDSALARSLGQMARDSSWQGIWITRDSQYVCGYAFIEPSLFDQPGRDRLMRELESLLQGSGFEYVISGIPYIRSRYVSLLGRELQIFLSLSVLLVSLILYLTYRRPWGVWVPTSVVVAALIWTLGLMGFAGQGINLISSMMIPIIFVVGASDSIHVTTRYLHELRQGRSRQEAMAKTLRELGMAVFLTSATTAVGFASLGISPVPPIREFGIFAAVGVLFAWLITVVLLPAALLRVAPAALSALPGERMEPWWREKLGRLYAWAARRTRAIFAGTLLLSLASGLLIFRIPTDAFLIEDIGSRDPARQAIEFFERQAFGLRPFELAIEAMPPHRISERETLLEIAKIQDWLAAQESFSPFLSPVSLVEEANYRYHFNRESYRQIPETQAEIDELLALAGALGDSLSLRVMSADGSRGRISARVADLGAQRFARLYADLEQFYRSECDSSRFRYQITGHAYLTERNLLYVRSSLLWGLSLAFVIIAVMMGILFRSWKMLIVSILPNIVPLLLTGGVMGLFGIRLTASTALVFVVSFGIAVDDTIHFLTRFRLERRLGAALEPALRATTLETGKAMIITSLILMSGFVVLLASDFGGTFNTGLFTALTILFALICDLLLLPALLRLAYRREQKMSVETPQERPGPLGA